MQLGEDRIMKAFGEAGFTRLIAAFYARVREDDVIGPLYPPDDWDNAEWRLRQFLIQRFGGSTAYSEQRGHPRLRMRHAPFPIGPAERDRWLELMAESMDEAAVPDEVRTTLWPFFQTVADQMRNRE